MVFRRASSLAVLLVPAHRVRGRTHALVVGRIPRGEGRQQAAALGHHAQAAEPEHLDLHRGLRDHAPDLGQREHTRQHRAVDAELLAHQLDGIGVRGGALHGQMQPQVGIAIARVGHQPRIGQDHGVGAQHVGGIDGHAPLDAPAGLRKRVDREQDLPAHAVRQIDARADIRLGEIEAGEVARVGRVLQAKVDGVGPGVEGGLERRQAACGGHQFNSGGVIGAMAAVCDVSGSVVLRSVNRVRMPARPA